MPAYHWRLVAKENWLGEAPRLAIAYNTSRPMRIGASEPRLPSSKHVNPVIRTGAVMERKIEVQHVAQKVDASFETFTQNLERMLGRFDYSIYKELDAGAAEVEKRLQESAGEEELMLFNIQDHGKLLEIFGKGRKAKAKQYVLGNPLIAITMTRHDLRAALYAPLRILVYEAEDKSTFVEFDLASSLFGQFGDPEVTSVALALDRKLDRLIAKAAA